MKILKRIVLVLLVVLVLIVLGGYLYFDHKFTPEENYLTVENESGPVSLMWLGEEKNVLLLPITFPADTTTYYLQFDTGSPCTVFYSNSIKAIRQVSVHNGRAKTSFCIGKTKITSATFQVLDFGNSIGKDDAVKIIGTAGADILDQRKTVLNFRENYIALNLSKVPEQFEGRLFDFAFRKRKIIINGLLKGKEEQFLFDSGTSAFELLTSKEVWEQLRLKDAKVNVEESASWGNVLTSYTASCRQHIDFNGKDIHLNDVTYVEGFSQVQYSMMKFSGMTGMLGNKLFLNSCLYIDCNENKMGIE